MPFTFKLSKRLALLKASLAASAILALACDRADLTSPQSFPSLLTQVVNPLSVVAVVASADDGNVPQNTQDDNLGTRWSANGDGQWIRYDLGAAETIEHVDIAWYLGDTRVAYFDIEVSLDAVVWTKVYSGQSSGKTVKLERHTLFPQASGRYVRILGHGNSTSSWNSVTEVDLFPPDPKSLPVVAVAASANGGDVPKKTRDDKLGTQWSADGDGQWIRYELGALDTVGAVNIAWFLGDTRIAYFDIEVSLDAVLWTKVYSGQSSGKTLHPERYTFPSASGRYVRIVGHGNSTSSWNSITEVDVFPPEPTSPSPSPSVVAVLASADDGNVPKNTLDNSLATRWSANGDGQWIRYELSAVDTLGAVDIAWYLGDTRIAYFDIEVSLDAVLWTKVYTGQSSGKTVQLERYTFSPASGRYVRIVGHGNSTSSWNSITEVNLFPPDPDVFPVVAVVASADDGNLPQNTRDDKLDTRWSANGDGQWIRYDLGAVETIGRVDIAWYLGDTRIAYFDVEVSPDAVLWTKAFSGRSTGTTVQPERYIFPTAVGRYVRILGHGNNTSSWNSIAEADFPRDTTQPPVAQVRVTPGSTTLGVGGTQRLVATLLDAMGSVLSGRPIIWASSAPAVATVSADGLVTGVADGSATITATSEGKPGNAEVTVSSTKPPYTLGNGANYYVAPSGSDANPCTAAAPCYTMARVSQLLKPGDNAHFASGTYTWSYSSNKVTTSGTATAPITYISDEKWGAKIVGTSCDPIWNSGDYVQLINFDVTTKDGCPEGIGVNGNYNRVIGNRVHDMPGSSGGYAGIHADCCKYTLTGIEIIGNVVDNIAMGTGSNLIHGIYAAGPGSIIMNNIVTRASAACITHYHGSTRSVVSNNVVANCKYGIQIAADPAITWDDYTTVNNNIAVNNGRGIYEYPASGSHNVYNNNIVYNNATADLDLCCGGTQSGTIKLTAAQFSALFVNYTGDMRGDYHLRSGAVAIDAGTTTCAAGVSKCVPSSDFDGAARPKAKAHDVGAYEY